MANKGFVGFSKSKYYEFERVMKEAYSEAITEDVLLKLKTIMKFDPNQSTYNDAMKLRTREYRAKQKQLNKNKNENNIKTTVLYSTEK